jgi:rubrerythrin
MTQSNDSTDELAERIAASVRAQREETGDSRRRFLSRSALAGGALLALGGGTGLALAEGDDEDGEGSGNETGTSMPAPKGTKASFDDVRATDVDVLNYALTLEHLEDVFYRQALDMFSEDDFANADALQNLPGDHRRMAYDYVGTVSDHEAAHVEVLSQAVTLIGGEPAPECTYNFGVETVGDFLELAQVLENTGVGAYAGAANFIESPDLTSAALSIHSVEARHAATLNALNGESPFPNAFDPALSQEEVLDAAGGFIESCSDGEMTGKESE